MVTITSLDQLDLNGTYTYADYLTWQFEELVELIKGKIYKMSPSPIRMHQKISRKFVSRFDNFLNGHKCEVYHAPFDVRLLKEVNSNKEIYTVVQPDICVICDPNKLDERGCIGAPDLIVEILSPSTSKKDVTIKFDLYEQNGVREYWIVYPGECIIDVFDLEDNKYKLRAKYGSDDIIPVGIFEGFSINANDIFE